MASPATKKCLEKRQQRLARQQEILALRLQKSELDAKIKTLTKVKSAKP